MNKENDAFFKQLDALQRIADKQKECATVNAIITVRDFKLDMLEQGKQS